MVGSTPKNMSNLMIESRQSPMTGERSINDSHDQDLPLLLPGSREKTLRDSKERVLMQRQRRMSKLVIPIIEGDVGDSKCVSGGVPFNNLNHPTDDTLKPSNLDAYYGAHPEQLHRRVCDELSGHIVPYTQHDLPVAPNFFLAEKGPDGSAAVAKRQACYDSALGARGINSLQSYGQKNAFYDNNAYTISSIYHNGQLQIFTTPPHTAS